jgi:hypothetical protein
MNTGGLKRIVRNKVPGVLLFFVRVMALTLFSDGLRPLSVFQRAPYRFLFYYESRIYMVLAIAGHSP